jgi:ABC-2 type transport system ATP-binding protein
VIHFEQVKKSFRRSVVLDGIDLSIAQGDRLALVGSNGAGKTTMIRCLLGQYNCEGSVMVDGLPPRQHRRQVLGRIGFVPQLPPPLKLPVGHLIRFAAGICGSEPEPMIEVAERLGLSVSAIARRPFVKLSGGEKQKLLIGIALGRDCRLLVLDEPAANLDPAARHNFFELLAERQERTSMIISSHRLDEVSGLVNRVVELDRGKIVLDDRVDGAADLASVLDCGITLSRPDAAFAKAIGQWGFSSDNGDQAWRGRVAGPDRLRFLGVLSRYAGLLQSIDMKEAQSEDKSN